MPSCVYRKCTNYTATVREANNISFHSFPTDVFIKEKWVKIIRAQRREDDWMPTKHSKVCSEHFIPNDIYVTDKNLRRLKKTAIPIIKQEEVYMVSTSPNSLECINISDEESIFDSPTTAFLKSKIEKISLDKRKLQLKNYNLARINKRLKEKCKNSKVINKRRQQLNKTNSALINTKLKEKCSNSKVIDKRRRQIKKYNLSLKYKNKKCNNLKEIVSKLQKKKYFTIDQINELNIKAEAVEFANRIITKRKSKGCLEKYSPELRKFAVTLHYYSVAAYKFVRQIFNGTLPHPRDINKWYENGLDEPGFNKQTLNMLRRKYKYSKKRIICTLITDEIALRHQTLWNGKTTVGVVDFGAGPSKSCEIATKAYVFILVGVNESWKIPVAYFLVNGLPAENRANLLKTCLSECYDVGVDIVAITFVGSAANINAANLLGCDLKNPTRLKTTFKHPDCGLEVAIMFDACHMIKLVRNSLECKRQIFDNRGKQIRWQLFVNLVNLQKNTGLNFESKLTPQHVNFRNQVIKVKLATQIMSISVANVLGLCNEILKSSLFIDTEGTINFIIIFNNLFDIFNSKSSDLYGFKKPLSEENADEIMAYLEMAKQYILKLNIHIKYRCDIRKQTTIKIIKKKIIESKNKTGFLGFLICIESLKHLYSTLVKGKRLSFIETYRLSQDHINILFFSIRRHGGYNNNSNAVEFMGIFKEIVQHLEKSSFSGNCLPLEDIHLLACFSAIENINCSVNRRAIDEQYVSFNEDEKIEATSTIDENVKVYLTMLCHQRVKKTTNQIVGYISGWISQKLIKLLKCETCIESLMSKNKLWFHKLIVLKYIGGLCLPSEDVFKICLKSEAIIRGHLKERGHLILRNPKEIEIIKTRILNSFINSDVFSSLSLHSLEQHPILNHRLHLIRAIVEKFVNVRMHFVQQELQCSLVD